MPHVISNINVWFFISSKNGDQMKFKITIKFEVFNAKFAGKKSYKNKMLRLCKGMLIVLSIFCSPMLKQLTWINSIDSSPMQSESESIELTKEDIRI